MEKLFSFRLVEPHELPFFNTAKIRPQNKPKSDANRQKRKKPFLQGNLDAKYIKQFDHMLG